MLSRATVLPTIEAIDARSHLCCTSASQGKKSGERRIDESERDNEELLFLQAILMVSCDQSYLIKSMFQFLQSTSTFDQTDSS